MMYGCLGWIRSLILPASWVLCALLSGPSMAMASFHYSEPVEVIRSEDGQRIRGLRQINGSDFVLGGLFPIHRDSLNGTRCGMLSTGQRGLERMEAMLYAIDRINSDQTLLPNITLGFDIRDTCDSEVVALDESLELAGRKTSVSEYKTCETSTFKTSSAAASLNLPTRAVIGASASAVSVPVATLLRLFRLPQVSYASSSARLNSRDLYTYFYRTVPADDAQATAMVDLALRFNWTYVSLIYANDYYGTYGIAEFRRLAGVMGICIDIDVSINRDFTSSDYQALASKLFNSSANVVVLFASQNLASRLLSAVYREHDAENRFLWIASDSWSRASSIVSKFNESMTGLFGIEPLIPPDPGFHDYYSQLTADNNKRNPWFKELYKSTSTHRHTQGSKVPSAINAVYSVAHALNDFLTDNCDQPVVWNRLNQTCAGQRMTLNGSTLLQYLMNVTFNSSTGQLISFNEDGSIEGLYNILNYQQSQTPDGRVQYGFVKVGKWVEDRLILDDTTPLQFGLRRNGSMLPSRKSECTICGPGNVSRAVEGSCCGTCDRCMGRNFSNEMTNVVCRQCETFSWGNNPLVGSTGCIRVAESYIRYGDPWSIILLLIAAFGLLASAIVFVIILRFWNTVIIKSASREQMIFLLVGICGCFLFTVAYVSRPSIAVCFFQRIGLWVCYSIIFGALLVKLVRIARIFLRKQFSAQLKLMGAGWQILFTFIVIAVELVLVIISLATAPPLISLNEELNPLNSLDFPSVILTCRPPHIAMLIILAVYNTGLLLACNALALMTIRFPDNFNEAKHVAFSTFSIGLIWLAFIPTFFSTRNVTRTAIVSFAMNSSALAVLMCMFVPRLLVIVLCPERNTIKYMRSTLDEKTRTSPENDSNHQLQSGYTLRDSPTHK